eukprot:TRINITY_DN6025_c0_g1_i8.p1 TRINITY_DN6025_c0_g1~~TRINITY_DN6025_c0_g1_i8.p1  ORF type:complete len:211 (-),score=33.52 TRINITY_DN6025_c0_g1_i8:50-682(-)
MQNEHCFATAAQGLAGRTDSPWEWMPPSKYHGGYLVRRNVTIPSSSQSGSSITSERERDECPINEQDPARLGEQHGHDDMCVAELHVLFSQVFNVPVMYFNIYQPDGMLVMRGDLLERMPELQTASSWANLTQAEHPVLGLPFFLLHPCNTQGFMNTLLPQVPHPNSNTRTGTLFMNTLLSQVPHNTPNSNPTPKPTPKPNPNPNGTTAP